MPALIAKFGGSLGLRDRGALESAIAVSADEPEQESTALKFLEDIHVPMPAYIKHVANDEAFINSIDRQRSGALPAVFIYDREGRRSASFYREGSGKSALIRVENQRQAAL